MADDAMVQRVLDRLRADESPARAALLRLVWDQVLDTPAAAFLPPDRVAPLILEVLGSAAPQAAADRHGLVGWDRWTAHVKETGERVKDLLPEDVQRVLVDTVATAQPPAGRWMKGRVDAALFRQLFAPVLQDMLVSFASRLPIPGMPGGGGPTPAPASSSSSPRASSTFGMLGRLKAEVEKRTEGIRETATSVLGSIGSEVEQRMQAVARDFSQSAHAELRSAMIARLKSEEGKMLVGRIQRQIVEAVLEAPLHELDADARQLPLRELIPHVGRIAAHLSLHPPVEPWLSAELESVLALEGGRTVRSMLQESNLIDRLSDLVLAQADDHTRALVATDAFEAWLTDLLA
jgi:hypothetical protein